MFTKRHKNRPKIDFTDVVDMCEQHHKDSVSIKNILNSYTRTGVLSHAVTRPGAFLDVAAAPDFIEAQRIIANAKSTFEAVPAVIRAEFNNDPAQFLEFISDQKNEEKMIEYGFDVSHFPHSPAPSPAAEISEAIKAGFNSLHSSEDSK